MGPYTSLNNSTSDSKFFKLMTVKYDVLKFNPFRCCFCKFTNNGGEINVFCDFFFDRDDGQMINPAILCHRRAQIIFNKLQF